MKIRYNQASAGAGKTYSIETELCSKLAAGEIKPSEVMAVTFTRKAAEELQSRITTHLLQQGETGLAAQIMESRIGTVHSVFGQLIDDFAFELSLPPNIRVADEQEKQRLLDEALDLSLSAQQTADLNKTALRLSVNHWQTDLLKIIEEARSNNLESPALTMFSKASIDQLRTLLPPQNKSIQSDDIRRALQQAVRMAKKIAEPTKGLLKVISSAEDILHQSELTWQNWVKIGKFKPTKCGEAAFEAVIALGQQVLTCSEFQQDLFSFIEAMFEAAASTMETFADLKARRGLVDFVDQERLAFQALQLPDVRQQLKQQISFLIVDEFQDTNPMQLALVSIMSEIADDVLLVGDAKQAIYGFRGSDPRLALDVLKHVEQSGGSVTTLPYSWRSRPGLVHLCNDLFTQPFSHLLKPDQITLKPKMSYPLKRAELEWWDLDGSNKDKRQTALAYAIREQYERREVVFDKATKQSRTAQWRDIAVLCRSNDEAAELAEKCAMMGVPVALERSGLIETPEVTLVLACLRRLIDSNDSLASAEILSFFEGKNASCWLKDRITCVENKTAADWNKSAHQVLATLDRARADIGFLSPSEALLLAIKAADVEQFIVRWSEKTRLADHRLSNIAKLISLATDYEDHCRASHKAATVGGYILWLRDLEQSFTDHQASNPGDAVNICTYHKSKGLEWPIVICTSLNASLKYSLFGVRVRSDGSEFNWSQPLAGRSINYWPNPFPDQRGNDPLSEIFQSTNAWKQAKQQAINEAIQLLYVGFTRARDQLILTQEGKNSVGEWLKLLSSPLFPLKDKAETLSLASGIEITIAQRSCTEPNSAPAITSQRERHWLASGNPDESDLQLPFHLSPSGINEIDCSKVSIAHRFGQRIVLKGRPAMDKVGDTIHHIMSLYLMNPGIDDDRLQSLVLNAIPGILKAEDVKASGGALLDWIQTEYPDARLHTELPFSYNLPTGQLCSGRIDLALELADSWILIDHKSNPQPEKNWCKIAEKHSGQLAAYADALATLSGKPVARKLVHFSVAGGLVEVA